MGGQIAHLAALAGHPVRLVSRSRRRLDDAVHDNRAWLQRRVTKGALSSDAFEAALGRVETTIDLSAGVRDSAIIVESIAEDRAAKRSLFSRLDEVASPTAVICSNSSTLRSSEFADCLRRPERLLNLHFFNPALVMRLAEVVPGPHTGSAAVQIATDFATGLGKTPVLLERESYGFVANRILFIAVAEAFRLVEEGVVSIEDADLAVQTGLGWPMGPFALADLIGLDVVHAILREGHAQTGEERWAPPTILSERLDRGDLGRKTGAGFHRYG